MKPGWVGPMQGKNDGASFRQTLIDDLRAAGLTSTESRLALLQVMRTHLPHHFTTDDLRRSIEAHQLKASVATMYNCLKTFTRVGLLRRVQIVDGELHYETRADAHHHVFEEASGELIDLDPADVEIHPGGTIRVPAQHIEGREDRGEMFVTVKA